MEDIAKNRIFNLGNGRKIKKIEEKNSSQDIKREQSYRTQGKKTASQWWVRNVIDVKWYRQVKDEYQSRIWRLKGISVLRKAVSVLMGN